MGFYEELSKYYDIVFPLGKPQLNFIGKRIKGKQDVLDLAAGTGNYSIALAKEGYNVSAVDLDEEMIKKIAAKNKKEGTDVEPYVLDMKKIDVLGDNKFDAVVCIGNSLVHLDNKEEIKDLLNKMYGLLRKDGVVILQIVNYDRVLKYDVKELPLIDRPESGVRFVRNYELEDGKVLFKTELIINNERSYDNCIKLYPLQSQDFVELLKEAGFRDIKLHGGFDEKEYTIDSFPLVVEAYK
ncbi:class I SAM-dependent methyltransferase [Wukongibacter baidiensis]|uniref:class I SAM-dependent methyltransferase n=1 Tax=Wukongibacter baidiensis TaxID=1723361 RepID=UPI003D7F67F6